MYVTGKINIYLVMKTSQNWKFHIRKEKAIFYVGYNNLNQELLYYKKNIFNYNII